MTDSDRPKQPVPTGRVFWRYASETLPPIGDFATTSPFVPLPATALDSTPSETDGT